MHNSVQQRRWKGEQKNRCLNGVGSHQQSPECNVLDPHLITSQKNRERKKRAAEPRKVFTSLSSLSLPPFPICLQSLMEKLTAPELILSHIALILIDLDISSPFYYLQHGITICPLGTHSHLFSLTLAGSFCTGECSLPVGCMEWSCKDTASDLAGELRAQTMRIFSVRG